MALYIRLPRLEELIGRGMPSELECTKSSWYIPRQGSVTVRYKRPWPRSNKTYTSSILIEVSLFCMEYIMYKWDLDRNWTARLSFMALEPVLKTVEDSLSLLPHLRDWTWTRVLCLTPQPPEPVPPCSLVFTTHHCPPPSTWRAQLPTSRGVPAPRHHHSWPSLQISEISVFWGTPSRDRFGVFFLSAHVFLLSRDLIWERMWLWLVPRHFKEKTGFKSVKSTCLNLLIDCCSLNRLTLWRM